MKPTREQIEEATERKIRVMIAEMLGWKRWTCDDYRGRCLLFQPGTILGTMDWTTCGDDVPLDECAWMYTPNWPGDIATAMQVVEYMRTLGYRCEMKTPRYQHGDAYEVCFRGHVDRPDIGCGPPVIAKTMPLAICRAALYRWIEQPESEQP